MLKILLLGAAFYVVYLLFFKKSAFLATDSKKGKKPAADEMLPCEACQTYTTVEEMIIVNGKYYCSKECAKDAQ